MAGLRFYLLSGAYHADDTGRALPSGAIEVPRLPGLGEAWDAEAGAFVVDQAVVADMTVTAGHIDAAHALKAAEAAIIASGLMLTQGVLVEEAAAIGVPLADLAADVLARSAEFRAAEVARRAAKHQAQEA